MKNLIRFHPFVVHRWWSKPHSLSTPCKAAANNSERTLSFKQKRDKMTQAPSGASTGICWQQRTQCSRFWGSVSRVQCATAWWFIPCDLHRQDHKMGQTELGHLRGGKKNISKKWGKNAIINNGTNGELEFYKLVNGSYWRSTTDFQLPLVWLQVAQKLPL